MLEFRIDYSELKEKYLEAAFGLEICKNPANQRVLANLVSGWRYNRKSSFYGNSGFYGCTTKQMKEWLKNGYVQPGLVLEPPIDPVRKKRKVTFQEEGELQVDLALSGYDYPYLNWGTKDILPGMTVRIRANFVCTTNAQIIADYYRWVLRALIALEEAGIDLEVTIVGESLNLFTNSQERYIQFIRVKKEGEQTDFLSWSPILSPGGYRHLGFLSDVLGSDYHEKQVSASLGRGSNMNDPWAVSFDPDTRALDFSCPYTPRNFPEHEMETQLRIVLNEARRAA